MNIVEIDKGLLMSLEVELSLALTKFSNGKLDINKATEIAKGTMKNIDFSNSAIAHKGINWFAKEIIDVIEI